MSVKIENRIRKLDTMKSDHRHLRTPYFACVHGIAAPLRLGARHYLLLALLCVGAAVAGAEELATPPAVRLEGNRVLTERIALVLGASGLPEQVEIAAAADELSLHLRQAGAPAPDANELARIGRGGQLRAPLRLEASAGGKTIVLAPVEPAKPALADGVVSCVAKLGGAEVTATLQCRYGADGELTAELEYGGKAAIESLVLVMDLAGPVDTVVSPNGVKDGCPLTAWDCGGTGEGVIWDNVKGCPAAPTKAPASGPATPPTAPGGPKGVPTMLFWGSGDRGFTWLSDNPAGWQVDPAVATMTLTRDKAGLVTWRAYLVNKPGKIEGQRKVSFTLLTHPCRLAAANRRAKAWLDWPFAGKAGAALPLTAAGRAAGQAALVRADSGTVYDSVAQAAVLEGPAGGDALSAQENLAETYPLPLFRYLAGTHTHLPYRLRTNADKLARPGQSQACDRMAIGRALLHDIGLDPAGIAHRDLARRTAEALVRFGAMKADGQTEFLPYWRNRGVIRYGEEWKAGDQFEVTTKDPNRHVKVSVWRRPVGAAQNNWAEVMILVVNEGAVPVEQRLFVLDTARLFGTANALNRRAIIEDWDFSGIPPTSYWNRSGVVAGGTDYIEDLVGRVAGDATRKGVVLRDMEDDGYLAESFTKGNEQVYVPLAVPAYGFRLLYGTADLDRMKRVRPVPRPERLPREFTRPFQVLEPKGGTDDKKTENPPTPAK